MIYTWIWSAFTLKNELVSAVFENRDNMLKHILKTKLKNNVTKLTLIKFTFGIFFTWKVYLKVRLYQQPIDETLV